MQALFALGEEVATALLEVGVAFLTAEPWACMPGDQGLKVAIPLAGLDDARVVAMGQSGEHGMMLFEKGIRQ